MHALLIFTTGLLVVFCQGQDVNSVDQAGFCPEDWEPELFGGSSRPCDGPGETCSDTYTCEFGSKYTRSKTCCRPVMAPAFQNTDFCPNAATPQMYPQSVIPHACSGAGVGDGECEAAYTCQESPLPQLKDQFTCCPKPTQPQPGGGLKNSDYCPNGGTVGEEIFEGEKFAYWCETQEDCYDGNLFRHKCVESPTLAGEKYCCKENPCPNGAAVETVLNTDIPRRCLRNYPDVCTYHGNVCVESSLPNKIGAYYCCASAGLPFKQVSLCPNSAVDPEINAKGRPQSCRQQADCGSGYYCQRSPNLNNRYFCCPY